MSKLITHSVSKQMAVDNTVWRLYYEEAETRNNLNQEYFANNAENSRQRTLVNMNINIVRKECPHEFRSLYKHE